MAAGRECTRSPAWLDVQRNIGAVNITLGVEWIRGGQQAAPASTRRVRVFPGKICATKTNEGREDICVESAGVRVIPESCNGLRVVQGRELRGRFELQNYQDVKENAPENLWRQEREELRRGTHTICCRACGHAVLPKETQFKRVLELPSEHWQELAQEWCCHSDSLPGMTAGSLNPLPGDCLVGSHYLLLHPSSMEPGSAAVVSKPTSPGLKCGRCRATLGDVLISEDIDLGVLGSHDVTAVQLYKHTICLEGQELFRSYSVERFISRTLLSTTRGATNFKFLIQGPSRSKTVKIFALLWLLNPDATVLTNVQRWLPDSCRYLSESTTSNGTAQPQQVLKVLYKMNPQDTEQQIWLNNPAVEQITFSRKLCLEMLIILAANTCTLPSTTRSVNGFQLGFLQLSSVNEYH